MPSDYTHDRMQVKPGNSNSHASITADRSATISRLPVEMIRCIFSHCASPEDIICLGLSNRQFWAIGREYVAKFYA